MTLSELSIRRPVFAWMLMLGLIIFGAISFTHMGISQLPDVDFPVVNVQLNLHNAAPEVMETEIVDPVEDAIMGIEGIRTVTSNCSQGTANVTVEFELDRSIDVALQEVQTRIAQAQKQLPTGMDPPVITKTNPEDQPILWVMLTSDGSVPLPKQMIYARNTLKDQFSTVSGVGDIQFGGYVDPNLRVWLSAEKLKNYQLTAADIVGAIQKEQLEVPSGRIENPKKEFNVRLIGEAATTEDFGKILINTRGGTPNYQPIPLSKVARIEEGLNDVRAISRYNGKSAVGLGIVKQRGSNAVAVAKAVGERVERIRPALPKGLSVDVRLDTTRFIKESVSELNFTLILSAILTSIVCFLFLGSWSSTINVLFAIPTSVVGAFIVLSFMGFTLNTFTLLGLSLAIGIVVDDAIMMLENIVRHSEMGKNRVQAAIDGSNEITFAALAATIAIAAIFVPVIFIKGVIGRFFFQYGITVTVAVLLSLLEALTLTPMRCAEFLETSHEGKKNILVRTMDSLMMRSERAYKVGLEFCIKHRYAVLSSALLFFVVTCFVAAPLRKELIPEQDQSLFLLNLKTPVGSSITATDLVFRKVEDILSHNPNVKETYTTVGGGQGTDVVNQGAIYVTLVDANKRKLKQRQVMDKIVRDLRAVMPENEIFAQDLSLNGFTASRGYPLEMTVQGPNWEKLVDLSKTVITKMKSTGLMTDINTDYQEGMPEIQIMPDRTQAADHAVAVSTIGNEVNALIGGEVLSSLNQYPQDGHRYDIRVQSEPAEHSSPSDLDHVFVRNNYGTSVNMVPLKSVVTIQEKPSLQVISRQNRERSIPIYANIVEGKSQQDALEAVEKIGKETLPPGYHVSLTGSALTFRDSAKGLIFALILGIAVAYMVLASQFDSFIHPITVLLALPFSLSGAFVSLYFAGQSLNLFSMIGLILLMGIVKKNSILLVDFTNQRRAEGLDAGAALLEACPVRLRPIVMTSVATIAGALPAALALGPGSETRVPMAISIIGGVSVSTLLTLFVVPCAYSIFSKFESKRVQDNDAV